VELYLYSPIHRPGLVLIELSTGTIIYTKLIFLSHSVIKNTVKYTDSQWFGKHVSTIEAVFCVVRAEGL
jgi:hypothetical protein